MFGSCLLWEWKRVPYDRVNFQRPKGCLKFGLRSNLALWLCCMIVCYYSVGYHIRLAFFYSEVWTVKLEFASSDSRFLAKLQLTLYVIFSKPNQTEYVIYTANTDGQCCQPQLVVAKKAIEEQVWVFLFIKAWNGEVPLRYCGQVLLRRKVLLRGQVLLRKLLKAQMTQS